MELKNLNNLKDEIAYLEEAEELLQAIYSIRELRNDKRTILGND